MGLNKGKNVVQTEKDLKSIFPKINGIDFIFKLFGTVESTVKPETVMVYLAKFVKFATQIEKQN